MNTSGLLSDDSKSNMENTACYTKKMSLSSANVLFFLFKTSKIMLKTITKHFAPVSFFSFQVCHKVEHLSKEPRMSNALFKT